MRTAAIAVLVVSSVGAVAAGLFYAFAAPRGREPDPRDAAMVAMKAVSAAVSLYYLERRSLPTTLDELTQPSPKLGEPYLGHLPRDPWGQALAYRTTGTGNLDFVVSSAGADETLGTADDLVWSPGR